MTSPGRLRYGVVDACRVIASGSKIRATTKTRRTPGPLVVDSRVQVKKGTFGTQESYPLFTQSSSRLGLEAHTLVDVDGGLEGPTVPPTTRRSESVAVGVVPGALLVGPRPVPTGLLTPAVEEAAVLPPETAVVAP